MYKNFKSFEESLCFSVRGSSRTGRMCGTESKTRYPYLAIRHLLVDRSTSKMRAFRSFKSRRIFTSQHGFILLRKLESLATAKISQPIRKFGYNDNGK